jgi:hypothetical protein
MADPTEMRVKEQRRAEALRANLKRRKAQSRTREIEPDTAEPAPTMAPTTPGQRSDA